MVLYDLSPAGALREAKWLRRRDGVGTVYGRLHWRPLQQRSLPLDARHQLGVWAVYCTRVSELKPSDSGVKDKQPHGPMSKIVMLGVSVTRQIKSLLLPLHLSPLMEKRLIERLEQLNLLS